MRWRSLIGARECSESGCGRSLISRIILSLAGAGVGHGEAAVGRRGDFEYAPSVPPLRLAIRGSALLWAASEPSAVWSIQRSSRPGLSWTVCQASGLPALWRAVVHDGDAGVDGVDEGLGVGQVEAVMVDEVEIDRADEVVGADERDLLGLGEVAEVEEAELAEADKDAGGAGILRVVEVPLGSVAQ